MTATPRTRPITVHRDREHARQVERTIQHHLDTTPHHGHDWRIKLPSGRTAVIPGWAHGARVDRVGWFEQVPGQKRRLGVQFCVVVTESRGH